MSSMADAILDTSFGTFAIDRERDPKIFKALTSARYEPLEFSLSIIASFAGSDSTVIDAGAHIGTFSIPLSKSVKRVIAFEPSPSTFAYLAKNIGLNHALNVEIHNKGLAAQTGFASLEPIPDGLATSQTLDVHKNGTIPVVSLDAVATEAAFIKIDVEGMELQVLEGATKLIDNARPAIFFEVNRRALREQGTRVEDIGRFFAGHGYSLWYPFEYRGRVCAGRVRHILALVCLTNPGSIFLGHQAYNFDLLAVPKDRPFPSGLEAWSEARMAGHLISLNFQDKIGRIRRRLCSRTKK